MDRPRERPLPPRGEFRLRTARRMRRPTPPPPARDLTPPPPPPRPPPSPKNGEGRRGAVHYAPTAPLPPHNFPMPNTPKSRSYASRQSPPPPQPKTHARAKTDPNDPTPTAGHPTVRDGVTQFLQSVERQTTNPTNPHHDDKTAGNTAQRGAEMRAAQGDFFMFRRQSPHRALHVVDFECRSSDGLPSSRLDGDAARANRLEHRERRALQHPPPPTETGS